MLPITVWTQYFTTRIQYFNLGTTRNFFKKTRSVRNQINSDKSISWFSVTYREGFKMNTRNKNPLAVDEGPSFIQDSLSLPLPFESVRDKYSFLPLNASNSFGAVENVAQKIQRQIILSIVYWDLWHFKKHLHWIISVENTENKC